MTILNTIIEHKKREVADLPMIDVPERARDSNFVSALRSVHPSLIAEVKPKSPSEGLLIEHEAVPHIVEVYSRFAQAISVLCDSKFFGGGFDLLAEVRALTPLPLLAKEFILIEKQIDYANVHGADAVLLIASILEPGRLSELILYARSSRLDVLLEIHDEADLEKVLTVMPVGNSHVAIGINNRNLSDMSIDLSTTTRLAEKLRSRMGNGGQVTIISESGIHARNEVGLLRPSVHGFLIGTSLLRSGDIAGQITNLFQR